MTHYYHFYQQNSPSSYHHRNKGSLVYLEQFQNHPIGIPKLMKMHLKTFEHLRTPCFMENPGFFSWGGDWGGPPSWRKFCQSPPSDTCPRFWTKACPPPAEIRPRKFEKFKYIFVSNLTTFKLKSTLKTCISCLKWPNFALSGQFWLQSDFFRKSPIRLRSRRGPTGTENFESPPPSKI